MFSLLQSHPNASGLRNKPFPHFESLSIIFGKDRATGQGAEDPADAAAEILADTINLDADVEIGNLEGFESDSPISQPPMGNTTNRSNSSTQSQSTSRKRKANTEEALIGSLIESVNNIGAFCESTSQGIQDVASYFKSLSAGNEYQEKVYEGLLAIENLGLDESQMVEVGEIIASSPSTAKFFFSLPVGARKTFVLKKLGLS